MILKKSSLTIADKVYVKQIIAIIRIEEILWETMNDSQSKKHMKQKR